MGRPAVPGCIRHNSGISGVWSAGDYRSARDAVLNRGALATGRDLGHAITQERSPVRRSVRGIAAFEVHRAADDTGDHRAFCADALLANGCPTVGEGRTQSLAEGTLALRSAWSSMGDAAGLRCVFH